MSKVKLDVCPKCGVEGNIRERRRSPLGRGKGGVYLHYFNCQARWKK